MQQFSKSLVGVFLAFSFSKVTLAGGSKKPAPEKPRSLRKLIELESFKAKPILQNGKPAFDLEQAINLQAITAAISSGEFTVKTRGTQTFVLNQPTSFGGATLSLMSAEDEGLVLSEEESCLASIPVLRVGGEVLDLQLISASGASLKLSPNVGLDVGLEGEYNVRRTQFSAVYTAHDSGKNRILVSSTRHDSIKEKSGSARISFLDLFSFGFNHYQTTPIARVVERNLSGGFSDIARAAVPLAWEAPVMVSDGDYVALNAGFDVGIKSGDRFTVQNRTHYWAKDPCKSTYFGSRPDPESIAIVEAYDVQTTHSWARVVQWLKPQTRILPGARVQVQSLVK